MNDELHAAGFVEEALGDDSLLSWQCTEEAVRLGEVLHQLMSCGSSGITTALLIPREHRDRGTC
jgi:hypothetical protein